MTCREQPLGELEKLRGSRIVIIGIGNSLKGDDGLGPWVCRALKRTEIDAEIIDAGTVPENYINSIVEKAPDNLIIIDAVHFGGPPGTIKLCSPEQLSSVAFSTHALSPRLFLDLISRQIKPGIYIIGIEPGQIRLGQPLSAEVEKTCQRLIDALVELFGSRPAKE